MTDEKARLDVVSTFSNFSITYPWINLIAAASRMNRFQQEEDKDEEEPVLDVQSAVLYDTLLVLAEAVKLLNFHSFLGPTDVSCLKERSWESGATFYNYINSVETEGITGKIRFKVTNLTKFFIVYWKTFWDVTRSSKLAWKVFAGGLAICGLPTNIEDGRMKNRVT